MQKNPNRSFTFYLILFGLFAMLMSSFQSIFGAKGPDYSQIRGYFNRGEVEYFLLDGSDLTITLKEKDENGQAKTVYYTLADPDGFMNSYNFDGKQ